MIGRSRVWPMLDKAMKCMQSYKSDVRKCTLNREHRIKLMIRNNDSTRGILTTYLSERTVYDTKCVVSSVNTVRYNPPIQCTFFLISSCKWHIIIYK